MRGINLGSDIFVMVGMTEEGKVSVIIKDENTKISLPTMNVDVDRIRNLITLLGSAVERIESRKSGRKKKIMYAIGSGYYTYVDGPMGNLEEALEFVPSIDNPNLYIYDISKNPPEVLYGWNDEVEAWIGRFDEDFVKDDDSWDL